MEWIKNEIGHMMELSCFYFLVVLYKKKYNDSETLQTLSKCKGIRTSRNHLFIWDNSPVSLSRSEIDEIRTAISPCTLSYFSDGKNHYLSEIYNDIISRCKSDSLLALLDHDSILPLGYIKTIEKAFAEKNNNDINLFLPIILSNNRIVSPAYETGFRHFMWKTEYYGKISSKNLTAINSGMVIKTNYLKNLFPGYNPKLKFYETDNDFMRKYRRQNDYAFVVDIKIAHSLNFIEDNLISKIKRFHAMKEGRMIVAKEEGILIYYRERLRFFYLGIKYSIIFKKKFF